MTEDSTGSGRGTFIPVLLLAISVVGWWTFQSIQLINERNNLVAAIEDQEKPMEQSQVARQRLESLATRTARIAGAGNANATIIVEQLRKRGISIDPDAPVPEVPEAGKP